MKKVRKLFNVLLKYLIGASLAKNSNNYKDEGIRRLSTPMRDFDSAKFLQKKIINP